MSKRRSARLEKTVPEGTPSKKRKEVDTRDASKPHVRAADDVSGPSKASSTARKATTAKPLSRMPPKSSQQNSAAKNTTKSVKAGKPPLITQEFMGNLDALAPPMEDAYVDDHSGGIVLNEMESKADLGDDTIELSDSGDDQNKNRDDSEKESEDEEDEDEEETRGSSKDVQDNMSVRDVTKIKKRSKKKKASRRRRKVVEGDFEDQELAKEAKSSVRMAVCIEDMWPREQPSLTLLSTELGKLGNEDLLDSLAKMTADPQDREDLIRFMNYAPPQVRSDMGNRTRILVAEFFQFSSGKDYEETASKAKWLLDDDRFLEEVDLEARTQKGDPYASPLFGKILRSYFVDAPSSQDKFLIKHLEDIKTIPPRLMVMIACLIQHSITEWNIGSKTSVSLTRSNMEETYQTLWKSMKNLQLYSGDHITLQSQILFEEMKSRDFGKEPVVYDYACLQAKAKAELERRALFKEREETDADSGKAAGEAEVRFPAAEVEEEKEQAPVGLAAGSEVVVEAKAKAEAEEAGVEKEEAIVKMKKGKTKKTASRHSAHRFLCSSLLAPRTPRFSRSSFALLASLAPSFSRS
ncbi:hypothetical protein C8R42DRAFT_728611 [Lentinula raphanica]|nr:hypothetical protein C8R42DRAFT_728611 [Lentinula raphanica]